MGRIKVSLSANAGVCIEAAGKKIWVDALYTDKGSTFSALDPALRQWVFEGEAFSQPDYICYTHRHGDHYSEELTQQALEKWKYAKLIMPEQPCVLEEDGIRIECFRLPHAGAQYATVPLCGMLISLPEGNILLPGDCEVASSVLKDAVGDRPVDLAIVDFPWITLRRGQAFLHEHIKPKHILAYHLPFEADDVNGYRQATDKAIRQLQWDIVALQDPMQSVTVNI